MPQFSRSTSAMTTTVVPQVLAQGVAQKRW